MYATNLLYKLWGRQGGILQNETQKGNALKPYPRSSLRQQQFAFPLPSSEYHQSVGVRYTTVVQHTQHRYASSPGWAVIGIRWLGEGGLGCDGQG